MTTDRFSDEDAMLDAALRELPAPELPAELKLRLEAIPERTNVRRFPARAFRVSALGWAAAAALGLFIGTRSLESEAADAGTTASVETGAGDSGEPRGVRATDEDETLAIAVGSFVEFEEEP
jgi:hypothetical protein